MKTYYTLALILFSIVAQAQNYGNSWSKKERAIYPFVTVGFDLRNAISGSEPTGNAPSLDFHAKIGARNGLVEVGLLYENFASIDFQKYGVAVNIVFETFENVDVAIGLEGGSIIRMSNSNFLTYGLNGEIRYDLGKFEIGAQANLQYRPDLNILYRSDTRYVASGYLNLMYKLN